MFRHLGVSIDSSIHCSDAAIQVFEFAREAGARISLWYAQPRPDDPRAQMHNELRADEALTRTGAAAHAMGIPSRVGALFAERPAHEILNAAQIHGCDAIVTVRELADIAVPGSEVIELLSLASVPVLTFGAGCAPPRIPALELLCAEYRRLTGLLHQWLCLLGSSDAQREPAAHRAGMLALVEHIRSTMHPLQRRKEASLYGRLRRRFGNVRAEIDELLLLAQREYDLLVLLEAKVAQPLDREFAVAELSSALERYARTVWTARGREEGVILPAARRHLTTPAWDRLRAEFIDVLQTIDGASGGA